MQPRYEWQKGKDAWEKIEASGQEKGQVQGQAQGLPLQRRWRYLVAVILIIGLIGGLVFWFVDGRARNNTAAVEADILRTNSLIFQAVATGDLELLRSNLSGRDPAWVAVQERALSSGLIYDWPAWGLEYEQSIPDDSQIEVVLNPEWDTAEVTVPLDFRFIFSDQTISTFQLEQTLVYRRSRERWLLAPADVNFWGGRLFFEGRYLTINYPARDREIMVRMAADLDEFVGEMCMAFKDVRCPADFKVNIRFYTVPPKFSFLGLSNKLPPCSRANRELPTPTLIGLPVEGGYEILLQGYRSEIAAATMARLIYSPTCPDSPLASALLDYRLHYLFPFWPLNDTDYLQLLRDRVHLGQVKYFVQSGEYDPEMGEFLGDWRPFYALVDFLAAGNESVIGEIEKDINENPSILDDYWPTLHKWTNARYNTNKELELAWEQFLAGLRETGAIEAPELPEQDLRLVCNQGNLNGGGGVLFELDLAAEQWTAVDSLIFPNGYLLSLPGEGRIIVAEQRPELAIESARILLWEEGRPSVLFETADTLLPISTVMLPGMGETIMFYNRQFGEYSIFNWAECIEDMTCDNMVIPGFPIVSPSAEWLMFLIPDDLFGYEQRNVRPFILGHQVGENVGRGRSQFWAGDNQLGFVAEDGRTVMTIIIDENGVPEEAEVLFTLEEVDPLLALDEAATIESVLSNPKEPEDLIVTAIDRAGWASIYQVNILRRWIQPLKEQAFSLDTEAIYNFDFSPEGRWMVVTGSDLTTATTYIHLFDFEENEVHSFDYKMVFERPVHWAMDWSAGDEWLALPDNGYIRLIHPETEYQDVVLPEGMECSGAVWVN